jgi:hypothetical protein
VTGFELNEKLKERCIGLGADKAITQFFKKGVPIIPEPFYETTVEFPPSASTANITTAYQMILGYKFAFDEQYFFTDPLIEQDRDRKRLRIVYAIFLEDKPFDAEISFLSKLP